jgi:hypothetical protein
MPLDTVDAYGPESAPTEPESARRVFGGRNAEGHYRHGPKRKRPSWTRLVKGWGTVTPTDESRETALGRMRTERARRERSRRIRAAASAQLLALFGAA